MALPTPLPSPIPTGYNAQRTAVIARTLPAGVRTAVGDASDWQFRDEFDTNRTVSNGVRFPADDIGWWQPSLTNGATASIASGELTLRGEASNFDNASLESERIFASESSMGVYVAYDQLQATWWRLHFGGVYVEHTTALTRVDGGPAHLTHTAAGKSGGVLIAQRPSGFYYFTEELGHFRLEWIDERAPSAATLKLVQWTAADTAFGRVRAGLVGATFAADTLTSAALASPAAGATATHARDVLLQATFTWQGVSEEIELRGQSGSYPYYVQVHSGGSDLRLRRTSDDAIMASGAHGQTLSIGTDYTLTLIAEGNTYQALLGVTTAFSWSDPNHIQVYGTGLRVATANFTAVDIYDRFLSGTAEAEARQFAGIPEPAVHTLTRSRTVPAGGLTRTLLNEPPPFIATKTATFQLVTTSRSGTSATTVTTDHYANEVQIDGPIAYWRFSETGGTLVKDASPNGHDGLSAGAVERGFDGILNTNADGSVRFHGQTSESVEVPYDAAFDLSQFAAELWIYPEDLTQAQTVLDRGPNVGLELDASGHVVAHVVAGGTTYSVTSTIPLTASTWNHVAFTFDGAMLRLYIDGAFDQDEPLAATPDTDTSPVRIGLSLGDTQPLIGAVDEVAIYNYELPAGRIAAHREAATANITTASGAFSRTMPAAQIGRTSGSELPVYQATLSRQPAPTFTRAGEHVLPTYNASRSVTAAASISRSGASTLPEYSAERIVTPTITVSRAASAPVSLGDLSRTMPAAATSRSGASTLPEYDTSITRTLPSGALTRESTHPTGHIQVSRTLPAPLLQLKGKHILPEYLAAVSRSMPTGSLSRAASQEHYLADASRTLPAGARQMTGVRTLPVYTAQRTREMPAGDLSRVVVNELPAFSGSITRSFESVSITRSGTTAPRTFDGYYAAVLDDTPVGYWPLDEKSGSTAFDAAGVNAGTYAGSYTLRDEQITIGAEKTVRFDGGQMSASVGSSVERTVELWFKLDDVDAAQTLFSGEFDIQLDGGTLEIGPLSTTVAPGTIYHLAVRHDGSRIEAFVNRSSIGAADDTLAFSGGAFTLGGIAGEMGHLAIYDTVLADWIIEEHFYAGTLPAPEYAATTSRTFLQVSTTRSGTSAIPEYAIVKPSMPVPVTTRQGVNVLPVFEAERSQTFLLPVQTREGDAWMRLTIDRTLPAGTYQRAGEGILPEYEAGHAREMPAPFIELRLVNELPTYNGNMSRSLAAGSRSMAGAHIIPTYEATMVRDIPAQIERGAANELPTYNASTSRLTHAISVYREGDARGSRLLRLQRTMPALRSLKTTERLIISISPEAAAEMGLDIGRYRARAEFHFDDRLPVPTGKNLFTVVSGYRAAASRTLPALQSEKTGSST